MKIHQIPLLRDNYGYLLVCEKTQKTAIVDPSEANAGFDYLRMELPIERFRQAHPSALLTA